MDKHKLPRTGQLPLAFEGEELKHASGKWVNGKDKNRWHELTLYRTRGGEHVLHIHFHTMWQGEINDDAVHRLTDRAEVVGAVMDHPPTQGLKGYPEGKHFHERQRKLEEDITARYMALALKFLEGEEGTEEYID